MNGLGVARRSVGPGFYVDGDDDSVPPPAPGRPPLAQRALMLQEELGAQRLCASVLSKPVGLRPRAPPRRGDRSVAVLSNAATVAAVAARAEAEAEAAEWHRRQMESVERADAQEVRVWRASTAAMQLRARVEKIAVQRHYWLFGLMRAFRSWAL
eukprot:5698431-Pleurochrysis_carterae.AAC.1